MGKIKEKLAKFFAKYFFNAKWRCVYCGKEIFSDEYFCEECKKTLPLQSGQICQHCGRKLKVTQNYCTTCKGKLVSIDKARSVYSYDMPISALIKRFKYNNCRYLARAFAPDMANVYYKNYFCADAVVFVPMTVRALKKRGYNQSLLLAEEFCKITGLELLDNIEKLKETDRQAKLTKEQRLTNLKGAFKIKDKKLVKDKSVVIIDDVTTTGATAEIIASLLKSAKARAVYLISVASVPPKDGY